MPHLASQIIFAALHFVGCIGHWLRYWLINSNGRNHAMHIIHRIIGLLVQRRRVAAIVKKGF